MREPGDSGVETAGTRTGVEAAPLLRRHSSRADVLAASDSGNRSVVTEAVCGAVGGTIGALVVHPIDTIKTRLQAGQRVSDVRLLTREGVAGLYRGIGVPLLSQPLYIGAALGGLQAGRFIGGWVLGTPPSTTGEPEGVAQFVFAGAVSGVCCAVAVTPGERLKVLLQADAGRPRGTLEAARSVARGGIPSIFRGITTTVMREVPGCVVWFAAYEATHSFLHDHGASRMQSVVGGATSAAVIWTVLATPLDVVKTVQQAAAGPAFSARTVVAHVLRTQGVRGLWAGMIPALLRNVVIDFIQFAAADQLRGMLRHE